MAVPADYPFKLSEIEAQIEQNHIFELVKQYFPKNKKKAFLVTSLTSILASMAWIDRVIKDEEVKFLALTLQQLSQCSEEEANNIVKIVLERVDKDRELFSFQLANLCRYIRVQFGKTECLMVIKCLCKLASTDHELSPLELEMMKAIAYELRVSTEEYSQVLSSTKAHLLKWKPSV